MRGLVVFAGLLAGYSVAAPLFPPTTECRQHRQFAESIVRASPAARMREVSAVPAYCRDDAVAQATYDLRAAKRLDESVRLANGFLTTPSCDPTVYFELAASYEAQNSVELAACHYGKALGLTANKGRRQQIDAAYARVSARLPAVPQDELACSRVLAQRIKGCIASRTLTAVEREAHDPASGSAALRIHFAYDRADLDAAGKAALAQLAAQLSVNPASGERMRTLGIVQADNEIVPAARTIALIGHTDTQGTDEYNMTLSRRRAETVRQALQDRLAGVGFRVEAKGKRAPLAPDAGDEAQHAINRRVEIRVE